MTSRQPPLTRPTLVGALRQGCRWEEFVALYGRLILAWGRRDFGLQASDAENLCQEVLLKVWKGIRGYDAGKGRFRNWLYACTRNTVVNLRRDRRLGDRRLADGQVQDGLAGRDHRAAHHLFSLRCAAG